MLRNILGVVAGIVIWFALVTVGGIALRMSWPAYAAVEQSMAFDLSMKLARLALSTVCLVIAALAVARVTPARWAALAFGVVMLAAFIPIHINLWPKFPPWYHLYFLSSLVILPVLTAWVTGRSTNAEQTAAS